MIQKLKSLELEISQHRGPFDLFGLFLRRGSAEKWDLVVSAKWFGENKGKTLQYLSDQLKDAIGAAALMMISRIVPLSSKDRFLSAVTSSIQVEHGMVSLGETDLAGVDIVRAYIITSRSAKSGRGL